MKRFEVKVIYSCHEDINEYDVEEIFEEILESRLNFEEENYSICEVKEI